MTPSPARRSARTLIALVAAGAAAAGPATAAAAPAPLESRSADRAPTADLLRARLGGAQPVSPAGSFSGSGVADTCPGGTERGATVLTEDFEDGLPDGGQFTLGWETRSGAAATGTSYATSLPPLTAEELNYVSLEERSVRPGTRTVLSFAARGVAGDGNLGVVVNDEGWSLTALEADVWNSVAIDITAATADFADGYLDVYFAHALDPAVSTRFDVDDVTIHHCAGAASGVRGDWTGGGTADLLAVGRDGALSVYPGRGDGAVGNGVLVGTGWGSTTWLGSPGDLDGDDRTDLLARRADGTLYRYSGRGDGAVAGRGVLVGTGWNTMTALTTGGDVDGNGAPDVLARRADGALFRYPLTSTGSVGAGRQIGTGWDGLATFVVVGDTNGDGRADVLGIDRSGNLYVYTASASGLNNGRKVGSGWGGMQLVNSPGDLDGDGRGDVVARSASGVLFFYAGTSTGLAAGTLIGSGWTSVVRLV